jgi:hypothetical protein
MQPNSIDTARLLPALRQRTRMVESIAERSLLQQRVEQRYDAPTPLVVDRHTRASG